MNREMPMTRILPSNWMDMRRDWSLVIGLVILVALYRLLVNVADTTHSNSVH